MFWSCSGIPLVFFSVHGAHKFYSLSSSSWWLSLLLPADSSCIHSKQNAAANAITCITHCGGRLFLWERAETNAKRATAGCRLNNCSVRGWKRFAMIPSTVCLPYTQETVAGKLMFINMKVTQTVILRGLVCALVPCGHLLLDSELSWSNLSCSETPVPGTDNISSSWSQAWQCVCVCVVHLCLSFLMRLDYSTFSTLLLTVLLL